MEKEKEKEEEKEKEKEKGTLAALDVSGYSVKVHRYFRICRGGG